MSKKIIFTIIISVIFIGALFAFSDSMTLTEIILAFSGASGTIGTVWNWFSKESLKKENIQLKNELKSNI